MADVTISSLNDQNTLSGSEFFPIVKDGYTLRTSVSTIRLADNLDLNAANITSNAITTKSINIQNQFVNGAILSGTNNCFTSGAVQSVDSSIAGGFGNYIKGERSFIGGGCCNRAYDMNCGVIAGGDCNVVQDSDRIFIGSGCGHNILCNSNCSSIVGGCQNLIHSRDSGILGGSFNCVCATRSGIVGGFGNKINNSYSFIGTGRNNSLSSAQSFVATGNCNKIEACVYNNIVNGDRNIIEGSFSTKSAIINGYKNSISGSCHFIGTGRLNKINTDYGTHGIIIGGACNNIRGDVRFSTKYNTIINGNNNFINGGNNFIGSGIKLRLSGNDSFMGSGIYNTISGSNNFIGGGANNSLTGSCNFIGGGSCNKIANYGSANINQGNVVAGGISNKTYGFFNVIVGGFCNTLSASQCNNIIVGGRCNDVNACGYNFIGGGQLNCINGGDACFSSILGGDRNINLSVHSSIIGGKHNSLSAGASYSFIAPGSGNVVKAENSAILGGTNNTIDSNHRSSFIIGTGLTTVGASAVHVNTLSAFDSIHAENGINFTGAIAGCTFTIVNGIITNIS